MKTILVLNGETDWQEYFPNYKVVRKRIQHTDWVWKNNRLYACDEEGITEPDAVLWRVGAIKPTSKQRSTLDVIALSGIPCINSATTLAVGYDRLTMIAALQQCGLPTIPFSMCTSAPLLKNISLPFPFVVKAGNYHGGFGKVLIHNEQQWQDIQDLLFISDDYIVTEPYIRYERDVRYLALGDRIWAMARKGRYWKSNVETTDYAIIEADTELTHHTQKLRQQLGADIIAVDILGEANGDYYCVEYNDTPGLAGFPTEVRHALAQCVQQKL